MNHRIASDFIFSLGNPGSEKALKMEVEMQNLGWRAGYQRRGFVTFGADKPFSLDSLHTPLACSRRLCLSLGKAATREAAICEIERLTEAADVPVIHHARFEERQMKGMPGGVKPQLGQLVGTIVELGAAEFWVGIHRHTPLCSPDPAGDSGQVMPADSPSRAWLKLEEAVQFFDLEFIRNDTVVELGCAPGGVVLALLRRGVSVIGVDPAKMADVVMRDAIPSRQDAANSNLGAWFYHCKKPASLVSKRDLGQGVTWFMSDMNQSPDVVLKECGRFCRMAPSICSVLITLKLTDLMQVAEKNLWFATLREIGFKTIRLQQLSVHHKEFALLATK